MDDVKIKICDVRELRIAQYCEKIGVDYLGIHQIKYPLTEDKKELYKGIRATTSIVKLVLVTQEEDIDRIIDMCTECNWDYVQLHFNILKDNLIDFKKKLQDISPNTGIISVVDVGNLDKYDINMLSENSEFLLYDSSIRGGTGVTSSTEALKRIKGISNGKDFFIAGGLNDKNVLKIISLCHPYAVDVQSGVEYTDPMLKHKKDPKRLNDFVNAVNLYNSHNRKIDDSLNDIDI